MEVRVVNTPSACTNNDPVNCFVARLKSHDPVA